MRQQERETHRDRKTERQKDGVKISRRIASQQEQTLAAEQGHYESLDPA